MAYGFNPIAMQVKQVNLGDIVSRNADKQIAYDTANIAQQTSLASLAKAQQDAQRQAALQKALQNGEINLNTPEGIAKYATYDIEGAKNAASMYKSTQEAGLVPDRRKKLQVETTNAENEQFNKDREFKLKENDTNNAILNRNAQTRISSDNALTNRIKVQFKANTDQAKAMQEGAMLVAAATPENRATVAAQVQQNLLSMGLKQANDFDVNNKEDMDSIVAMGQAAITAKSKSSGNASTMTAPFVKIAEDNRAKGNAAVKTYNTVVEMEKALPNTIVGAGSETRTSLLRLGESIGITGKNQTERLKNTVILIKNNAKLAVDASQAFKGQGTITDYERKILEKASTAPQSLSQAEITTLFGALKKTSIATYKDAEKRQQSIVQQFPSSSGLFDLPQMPKPPKGGTGNAPNTNNLSDADLLNQYGGGQ
jgi:hypothetical protein